MKNAAIIGAGAAGMFCAANLKNADVSVFEASDAPLKKVLVSGGGRCNFTNENIDSQRPENFYPRGANNLKKVLGRFSAKDARKFFESIGVKSKVEDGGRVFPESDNSSDIARALIYAARQNGAKIFNRQKVEKIERTRDGKFVLFVNSQTSLFDAVVLCAGGRWDASLKKSLEDIGHSFEPETPSLFSLKIRQADDARWAELSGVSVDDAEISADFGVGKVSARGAVLFTHFGLGGPAVLRLSAFAAKEFAAANYNAKISLNIVPQLSEDARKAAFTSARTEFAKKKIANVPMFGLPNRLWSFALEFAEVSPDMQMCALTKDAERKISAFASAAPFESAGKSEHKAEFVTCGGIKRSEVDFSTMQSRIVPNLFFAGECLDIDGVTGGFNLHSAWATGKICADFLNKQQPYIATI